MGAPVATAPAPTPTPAERAGLRPLQLVLAVGAVLVVSAAGGLATRYGGVAARPLILLLAAVGAVLAVRVTRGGLRSSGETLAACAVGLSLAATAGNAATPLLLAGTFLLLRLRTPAVVAWPIGAWAALQLAALATLRFLPTALHTSLFLGVALVGLLAALFGRALVARIALLTTGLWWGAGVLGGTVTAWTGSPALRWSSTALLVWAAAGLLLARLRRELDPLTGPRRAVPVVAGIVPAVALVGAGTVLGAPGTAAAGYLGVLLASVAATVLDGWPRGMLLPTALASGCVLAGLSLGLLTVEHEWGALSALLLLTAAPAALVAARRREDRPVAVPVAVGCLTGSVLLALPAGMLTRTGAAVFLTALYAMATLAGPDLEPDVRRPTEATAAVAGVVAAVLVVPAGQWGVLTAILGTEGLATLLWAWRAHPDGAEAVRVWRAGSAQLVAAAWIGAASSGLHVLEAYTLPAAVGVLVAAAPRLGSGRSWPTWGPALLVAAVPSTAVVVLDASGPRPLLVLIAAVAVLLAGARSGLRAPLMVGAATASVVGLRLSVTALPWPVTAALAIGGVLLAVGVHRERVPLAAFGARLAELR